MLTTVIKIIISGFNLTYKNYLSIFYLSNKSPYLGRLKF